MRGFAIVVIMVSHCIFYRNSAGVNALSSLGGLGVEFFIVLSGYLTFYRYYDKFDASIDICFKSCFNNMINKMKRYYYLHFINALFAIVFAYKSLFVEYSFKQWGDIIY